jgi:hypothetical protein
MGQNQFNDLRSMQTAGGVPAFAQSYMGSMGQQYASPQMQNPYGDIDQMQQQQAQQAQQALQQAQQARQLPAFFQDQEFQGYRQQQADLSRQMNDYMQKAPMYQQMQDLQNKMQGVQNRYASDPYAGSMGPGAVDKTQQAQLAGMPRNPMQQLGGVGGLAQLLGGFGQTLQGQPQERPQVLPRQGDWDSERQVLRSTGTPYLDNTEARRQAALLGTDK